MANTLIIKRSSVVGKVPVAGDLQVGELAVNLADAKLYSKNAGGTVIQLGGGSGSGDVVGPASATNNAISRFNGTTGKLIKNSVTTVDDTGNAAGILSQQFSDGTAVTLAAGKFWYNGTDGSWNMGMGNGNITQQVGEELYRYGKASAAITDSPLQLVYKTGVVGASGVITFAPAIAGITNGDNILGCATENIALNGFGRITTYGVVNNITTNGTAYGETWADNDDIYYNPATGGLTKTIPQAPNLKILIGTVIVAGNGGSGKFIVKLGVATTLANLSDVQVASPANGHTLIYDAAQARWENAALSAGTGISVTNGAGAITIANTGVTSVTGTAPVNSSGGATPAISLASGYGDTQNPYASKTANNFLAAPNGAAGVPTFRAIVAADIPTLNQNTTGTASNVTGTVAVANGGTGATTAGGALTNLGAYAASNPSGYTSNTGTVTSVSGTGTVSGLSLSGTVTTSGNVTLGGTLSVTPSNFASQTANTVLAAPNGAAGVPTFRAIVAADVPTLNQNTTGTAANVTGTVAIANGGTGATTRQDAMDALAGATTSGQYLRGNGTDVVMSAIQAADVPTLNQNTTGSSGSCTGNSATATSSPLLSALGNYVWSASTLPGGYSGGIQSSFVQGAEGWQSYGSVMTMRTYTGSGGGALQMYVPYSPTYGGTGLQVRFGNYDGAANNTWTAWKTLLASDNYNSYSPTLTGGGASGTWGISVTGNAATATNVAYSGLTGAVPTWNQNTTGTAANVSGTVAVANGGTGATTAANALTNLGAYPSSNPSGYTSNTGTVTGVTATAPVVSSGGTAPVISMAAATAAVNGYMTSTYASKLDGIAAGATNVTNTNQLTNGAGFITSSGTAANVSGTVAVANGGTGATTAAAARTNLGATTLGGNLFTLANVAAIAFPRFNADNTVSSLDAATFRTAIGAGTSSTTGTVTSVGGTGTISGLTLTGTVTSSGNLTLGGNLTITADMIYDNFTATASQTTFTTSNTYTSGKIDVFVNGVRMVNGSDVTVTSGTTVVMAFSLPAGTAVNLVYPI